MRLALRESPGFSHGENVNLVESEKKNNNLFEVVNTGPDVASLEIGDIVLVEKYCAQMFEIEDAKYFITSEDKILGYIQDEN